MTDFLKSYCVPLALCIKKELNLTAKQASKYVAESVKKVLQEMDKNDETEKKKESKSKKSSSKGSRKPRSKKKEEICEYVYVRSPKKGERCCFNVDKKSDKYCSKHLKKDSEKAEQKEDKKVKKKPVEKIKTEKTKRINEFSEKLQSLITSKTPIIKIERNSGGYYVMCGTRIVINPSNLEAYARLKEDNDNELEELQKTDVEYCKENNIKYTLPSNLSSEENNTSSSRNEENTEEEDIELTEDEMGYSDIETDDEN
jgi:hypothetical protein